MSEIVRRHILLQLPPGIHIELLTTVNMATHEHDSVIIMWADRARDECPQCGEPVGNRVEDCPVILNGGASVDSLVMERDQSHSHCGQWLHVDWREMDPESTEQDVLDAAAALRRDLDEEIDAERARVRARLRQELRDALTRLAEPLDDGETREDREEEVRTGNEAEPGVYQQYDGPWLAWDVDPGWDPEVGDSEGIWVTEKDLSCRGALEPTEEQQ